MVVRPATSACGPADVVGSVGGVPRPADASGWGTVPCEAGSREVSRPTLSRPSTQRSCLVPSALTIRSSLRSYRLRAEIGYADVPGPPWVVVERTRPDVSSAVIWTVGTPCGYRAHIGDEVEAEIASVALHETYRPPRLGEKTVDLRRTTEHRSTKAEFSRC